MNNENPDSQKRKQASNMLSVVAYGAGFLLGGLSGLGVGALFRTEAVVIIGYAAGAIVGVSIEAGFFAGIKPGMMLGGS